MYNLDNIYVLTENWEILNIQVFNDEFDYNSFQNTAKETFEILFEHKDDDAVSKDLLMLVLKINAFGENTIYNNEEENAAKLVAKELCNQFADCWVGTGNGIDKAVFVVAAGNGIDCFIDTATFDLSELIENRF